MTSGMRRHTVWTVAAAVLLVAGCGAATPAPAPEAVSLAPAAPALPGLSVLLGWDAPVDLDLYVTDPTWETVYFANTPTRSGARLLRDVTCEEVRGTGPHIEIVHLPAPRPGRYRIGVDFIDACSGDDAAVTFRVAAHGGREVAGSVDVTETVHLERFLPIVLEIDLDGSADSLTMERARP
jgi:hypothetical protein